MDYKTKPSQRKAFTNYYARKTQEKILVDGVLVDNQHYDPEFKNKRLKSADSYYQRNKEKVLARMKKYHEKKRMETIKMNDPEEYFAPSSESE